MNERGLVDDGLADSDRKRGRCLADDLGRWGVASILIIDDDGFYRGLLRRILEDGGHQVMEGNDGEEGIEVYQAHRPELVITDIFMPGMDGSEVIQALKEINGNVRIIAVSGG